MVATNTAVDAINRGASNARVRLAMFMGGMLESGLNPNAVGDNGRSFGIFQIYLNAHPDVTSTQAKDPDFAVRYMLPAYTNGVNKVSASMWNANPMMAAATAAYYAERPKVMYPSNRINNVWSTVQSLWNGGDLSTAPSAVDNIVNNALNPIQDVVNRVTRWAGDLFGNTVNYVYFAVVIGGGAITVAVGFYILMKQSTRVVPAVKQVTGGYKTILGR